MGKYGIPKIVLQDLHQTYNKCAYCRRQMVYPFNPSERKESATIEHLNLEGPFYWDRGLKEEDLVICCGSCNSSRGVKEHKDWFRGNYCLSKEISIETVHHKVRDYIDRKYDDRGNYIKSKN